MPRPRKLPPGLWKRGDTYYARFRAQGRLIRKKLATNFDVACELLNELKARAARADFNLTDNDYLWKDLKTEFLKWAKQSVRHPEDYERDLKKFEEYCQIRSIRQVDSCYVLGYRAWRLGEEVSPRTVNREVNTLRNMLNKGVTWGRIGDNSILDLKPLPHDNPLKQRRSLTVEEVMALFNKSPAYLLPVWRMFMTTGIRRGELVNMKFSDVDFERKVVTVRAGTAKNHKEREIPLDGTMLSMIQSLHDQAADRQPVPGKTVQGRLSREHVFVTGANTPWKNPGNLLRSFYRICKRAGIEGAEPNGTVDIHSLRVSFTTLALENGAAPKAIQAILGHSTLAMTMSVYAKATEKSKRDAISALPFASADQPGHIVTIGRCSKDLCVTPTVNPVQKAHSLRTSPKSSPQVVLW